MARKETGELLVERRLEHESGDTQAFYRRLQDSQEPACARPEAASSPANNNRIDGYTYDSAGNLIADGSHTYTYDAENRLISVDNGNTSTFTYDGEGRRFSKTNSSSINSGGGPPWSAPLNSQGGVYDSSE